MFWLFRKIRLDFLAGVLLCLFVLPAGLSRAGGTYNVLVLNSYHRGYFWTDDIVSSVVNTFKEQAPGAKLFIEYMDTRRYDPNIVFPDLKHLYAIKYHDVHFDVIVLSDNNALEFLRFYRNELFPGVPIVFCGIESFNDLMVKGLEPITGVVETFGKETAIEVALKLHPSTSQIVIINNKVLDSVKYSAEVVESLKGRMKCTVIEITDFTAEQFLGKIDKFGHDTIVFLPNNFSDSAGQVYSDDLVAKSIQRCEAPMYTNNFFWVGMGPVGASVNSGAHHGKIAAEMAVRILRGENAENIPIIRKGPIDYMFDYNQLKHFGILLSQLPIGSVIVNEPKSFYYQYKLQIWIVLDIFVLLTGTVLVLSINVIRRKRAEQKLLEYQGQLRSMASELSLAEERERRRIATELHDQVSQSLVISKMKLEQLRESEESDHIAGVLDDVSGVLGRTITSSRLLTFDIGSPILYELGFEAAVAELITEQLEKHNIEATLEDDGKLKPLDDDIRGLLYRMVRELLINIVKHAQARKVKVLLSRVDTQMSICIKDNGIGFDPGCITFAGLKTGGYGLFSIRERLEQLGGSIEIKSLPGRGCTIIVKVPLKCECPIVEEAGK
jgi:signal transduction histidine kinase